MSKDKMTQTSVQHKRTSVSGNTPLPDQLEVGELALNLADKTIFTKDGSGIITKLTHEHDSALVQGQIDSNATSYLKKNAYNYNSAGDLRYVQSGGSLGGDNDVRTVKVGGVYGFGIDEGASVIFAETPGGQFMVNDIGVMLQEADLIVRTPNYAGAKKGSAIGFWKVSGMSLLGDSATIGTMAVDSASINKLTVGPDSADDAKLYFETGAGTHVLEGREEGAVDMHAWVSYDNAPQAGWRGLAYGDGKWIAVGERDPDRMMSSTDGINWTAIPVGPDYGNPDYDYRDILYDGSKWVALAWTKYGGGNERIQTSTDGVTWSGDAVITTTQSGGNWSSIAYDGTRYVAVGGYYSGNPAPGLIGYSTDAVNWTLATYTGNWLQSVVYADGQFVAVGISGACATSSDGVTWTQRTAPSNSWTSVAYGNDVWVAVSSSGTTRAMTSSDGVTWTLAPQYSVFEYDWQSITYGDGKFVAVSNNGSQRVMWSTNGTSWIAQTITSKVWYSVDYAAGKFVGVGNTTQVLILEHDTGRAGLFYDGELVATTENLRPLFEKLTDFVEDFNELGYDSALVQGQIDSSVAEGVSTSSLKVTRDSAEFFAPISFMQNEYNGEDSEVASIWWTDYGSPSAGNVNFYSKSGSFTFMKGPTKSGLNEVIHIDGNDATFINLWASNLYSSNFAQNTTSAGFQMTSSNIQPTRAGTLTPNYVDLGSSTNTWKDGHFAGVLYSDNTRFTQSTLAHGSSIHNKISAEVTATGASYTNLLRHTDLGLEFNADRSSRGWRYVNGSTLAMNLSSTGNATFAGRVTSQTLRSDGLYISLDSDLPDSVVSANNALFTDSDGVDVLHIKPLLRSFHDRINSMGGGGAGHDSALVQGQIDSALEAENYISTVNGVGPTPGSGDIGIHGGNTQTDAGSGTFIVDALAAKVRRITDTNTGTNYNPSNGIISLPLATTSSVQTQIDTSIDALKFQDSADVATVVDPKLPFGGSAQMTILHASWDASNGTTTPTILSSYGVSGITRISAGEYRVDFMANMVNANYTVTTGCGTDDYSGTGASPRTVSILSRTNSSVTVLCERTNDAVNEDNEYMSVMIIGNQVSS